MKKYSLYNDVLANKGFNRSLLFDTTRFKYYFISNELHDLFAKQDFKGLNSELIPIDFKSMLIENELIFETDYQLDNCLIPMQREWDFPFKITSFVVSLSEDTIYDLLRIGSLDYVSHFHFIINDKVNVQTIDSLVKFINLQICDSIEFSLISSSSKDMDDYFLNRISDLKKIIKFFNYSKINIDSELFKAHRYEISLEPCDLKLSKFAEHYFESLEHHTYFNRKIFISEKGEIKNSIECSESFGKIENIQNFDELLIIINLPSFQKLWFVKKENIDICKVCEFKNNCVDNRVPKQRNEKEYYHEKECVYNPYISKWEDEEGYRTLSECGVISNEHTFSIDHEKIAKINAELWPEE